MIIAFPFLQYNYLSCEKDCSFLNVWLRPSPRADANPRGSALTAGLKVRAAVDDGSSAR